MKKLTITISLLISAIFMLHAQHINVLMDFEKPLPSGGYALESAWGHVEHGIADNPGKAVINNSDKVYMGKRQAGNWNSGIKFVFDQEVTLHGKSKARINVYPKERPSYVYLKFVSADNVTKAEGWCNTTFPSGQWSIAEFNNALTDISFSKVEVYFSDEWGNTTAEATTYFDNLELFNIGDVYAVPQMNSWDFNDPANTGLNLEKTAGTASFADEMMKMNITSGLPWQEPCVWTQTMDNWKMGDLKYFWMRIKNESAGNDVGFTATHGPDWYGLNRVKIPTNDSMFRDVIIDLTEPKNWWSSFPDSLSDIRFDGPKGVDTGQYFIDFYRFVEDFPFADSVSKVAISSPYTTAYGLDHLIQLKADVKFKESVVAYIKTGVIWSVSDENIATISVDGKLTPLTAGTVTVYAASKIKPDVIGSIEITVLDSYEIRTAWEFNDPANTGLNLEKTAGTVSFADEMMIMNITSGLPYQEPNVWSDSMVYWPLKGNNFFWMRIKNESSGNGVGFTAIHNGNWYGLNRVNIPTNATEFTDVMIDLNDPKSWWGSIPEYINEIRFDGPKGVDAGTYYVDFYKFVSQRPPAVSIQVSSPFDAVYGVGSTVTLSAAVTPAISAQSVTWSVDNDAFATIDANTGVLTVVSDGVVLVSATAKDGSGISGNKSITVSKDQMPAGSISLTGQDGRTIVSTGNKLQILFEVMPLNTTNKNVTFSVDPESVASIDANGLLTGILPGNVTVTATANDGSGTKGTLSISVVEQTTAWNFDNATGWGIAGANSANASIADGKMVIEVTGADPYVWGDQLTGWTVGDIKWLSIGVKNETADDRGQILVFDKDYNISVITFPLVPNDNQYRDVLVNLTGVNNWNPGFIVAQFRLDAVDVADSGKIAFDYIRFSNARPITVLPVVSNETVILEFENFNDGGQGVGYEDKDASNNGGGYRPNEGVDIGGGNGRYQVGWTDVDDKLNFDIRVVESGLYNVTFNFATIHGWYNEKFSVLIDGSPVLSQVELPAPADFIPWSLDTSMNLLKGDHILSFVINDAAGGFDLNNMVFSYEGYLGNNDATLSSLLIGGVQLSNFAPATASYRVELTEGADTVATAVTNDPNASVSIVNVNGTVTITVTAEDGMTVKKYLVKIILKPSTIGVNSETFSKVGIYPNPTSDVLNITETSNALIQIYSMDGKLLMNLKSSDNVTSVNAAKYGKGLYLLKIVKNNESMISKFVVE